MPTTINRSTWTNDSGTYAAPVGDGTPITNAELQTIYNNCDGLFTGATFVIGGVFSSQALGTHLFGAGGTGGNVVGVRNTAAGTGNYAQVVAGNDALANIGEFTALSSTWTSSNDQQANALAIRGNGAGGLSLATTNASAQMRFYTGATPTERLRLYASGTLMYAGGAGAFPTDPGASLVLADTSPSLIMYESGAGTDSKWWRFKPSAGVLSLAVINDALSAATTVLQVTRSGISLTNMQVNTSFMPVSDNSVTCGGASNRWSNVYGTVGTFGDVAFENGWAFTEHDKVGIRQSGIAVVTDQGEVVAFFDAEGYIHGRGTVHDLDDLGWRRTTAEERATCR